MSFKYDSTPPQTVGSADRAADSNGWFNRALTVSFAQAAGDVSGPDTCSAAVGYAGPDTASASRSGTARMSPFITDGRWEFLRTG